MKKINDKQNIFGYNIAFVDECGYFRLKKEIKK